MTVVTVEREINLSPNELIEVLRKYYKIPDSAAILISNCVDGALTLKIELKQSVRDDCETQIASFLSSLKIENGESK